jgi:hypothetical protein
MKRHLREFIRNAQELGLELLETDTSRTHPRIRLRRPDGVERWFVLPGTPRVETSVKRITDLKRFLKVF